MMRTLIVAGLFAGLAGATSISYSDFSDITGLTLNGNLAATTNGVPAQAVDAQSRNVLRLANFNESEAGTAYNTAPIDIPGISFSTSFAFHVETNPGDPTDGFSFILQSQGVNAVGGAGDGEGYEGILSSLAIVFRDRGPAYIGVEYNGENHVGDGGPAGSTPLVENAIYDDSTNPTGNPFYAWIDYDGTTHVLNVYLDSTNTKPVAPILSNTVSLSGLGSQAWVGFTAGTGAAFGNNDILSWNFDSTNAVPEPGTMCLFGLSLAVAGFAGKRFRRR